MSDKWKEKPTAPLCCGSRVFFLPWFMSACPFRGKSNYKSILVTDHLYRIIKQFCPDGNGLFQDGNSLIHRAQGDTEWFDKVENDVNHILSALLSPTFHCHHHNTWSNIYWKNDVHLFSPLQMICIMEAKEHRSCSGGSWWHIFTKMFFLWMPVSSVWESL